MQRVCFHAPVAGLAVKGQGISQLCGGLTVLPLHLIRVAERVPDSNLSGPVAGLFEAAERLLVALYGIQVPALTVVDAGESENRGTFRGEVTRACRGLKRVPVNGHRLGVMVAEIKVAVQDGRHF